MIGDINNLNKTIDNMNEYVSNKESLIDKEYKYINELNPIIGSSIIAQSLAHEIKRLTNQIVLSTKTIRRLNYSIIDNELNSIDINCYYLSRYASVLDVNSRAKRRKYETFNLKEYLNTILLDNPLFYYHGEKYKYKVVGEDFQIRGIQANVKIILENIILNSLYWLDYFAIPNPEIIIELNALERKLIIYDNGKGIDKKISNRIFEPFFTNKPDSEGRGMGLFIVTELLSEFGADISLSEDKNIYDNQYKFVIEFLEG